MHLLPSLKGSEPFNPLHCSIPKVLTLHFEESTVLKWLIFSACCVFQPVFIRSAKQGMQCYRCESWFVLNFFSLTYFSWHSLFIVDAKRIEFSYSKEKWNNTESRIETWVLKITLLVCPFTGVWKNIQTFLEDYFIFIHLFSSSACCPVPLFFKK